jgi:hypothetical protein
MFPAPPLGSWWTDHLQLPGYDPIATAGPSRFDPRAAEQALGLFTQLLPSSLSRWEAAIILNLWGWRQADGRRRYATVYAEPYRHDALALWCATLGLLLLCTAPPRRTPQVTVTYAQDTLAAEASAHVVAAIAGMPAWTGTLRYDPARPRSWPRRGAGLRASSSPLSASCQAGTIPAGGRCGGLHTEDCAHGNADH